MTINEFRENYPTARIETNLRHYKPQETIKVGWFKTVTNLAECIVECKIFQEGFVISSGSSYERHGGSDGFLESAEDIAIINALSNLKQ